MYPSAAFDVKVITTDPTPVGFTSVLIGVSCEADPQNRWVCNRRPVIDATSDDYTVDEHMRYSETTSISLSSLADVSLTTALESEPAVTEIRHFMGIHDAHGLNSRWGIEMNKSVVIN